ncbi:MAG: anti-sigma factor, partial [Nodosilinea sp.]
ESATLGRLLRADPSLQRDLDQMQQALEVVYAGDQMTPPAHLRQAVLSAATAAERETVQPMLTAQGDRTDSALGWGTWRWRLAWTAAVALIAGLSLSHLMLWRTLRLERAQRPSSETITVALSLSEGPENATPGQAQVVINPDSLAGFLRAENLPPLEPGSVYVLWTVLDPNAPVTVDQKNAILTTVFTVDEQGNVTQPIDLPAVYRHDPSLVRAVAISKEQAAAPQAHQSPPLLIQPL